MNLTRLITRKELPILKDYLTSLLPESSSMLATISVHIKFDLVNKIYVSEKDPTKFIFSTGQGTEDRSFCTFWEREKLSRKEIINYLKSIPDWKWDLGFIFGTIYDELANELHRIIMDGELTKNPIPNKYIVTNNIFHLSEEMSIPSASSKLRSGYKFGTLNFDHIPYIVDGWKYSDEGVVPYLENFLGRLPNVAIFEDSDNNFTNPVSWLLLYPHGLLGMLHTIPEYRRLGLASASYYKMIEKLKENGLPIVCEVEIDNEASLEMHRSFGFAPIGKTQWGLYLPDNLTQNQIDLS